MSDKKMILIFSLLLIAISIALTAFLPENEFMHAPFQIMVISVILLSIHMQMKDIIIIVMLVSAVIWGLAFYEVINQTRQLIAENVIIFAVSLVLGLYETGYREEKHKLVVVANYKKKETETLRNEITALNAENHSIMEKIKEYKKYF